MANQRAIVTENLTRRFGETVAVNNLTLDIGQGEVFGLLGHNGAGKTTTVRLLNGVLTANAGHATVLGLSPATQGPELRRKTGVLTETPSLDERLTARDNLRIYAALYDVPRGEVNARVDQILADFDLTERANEKVGGYSKGMKQRLALARALMHQPEALFLDEPTAGLDPVAAKQVNDLIIHLSREEGRTVVLATHNLVDAQRLCDRVGVLEHGKLVAIGTPAELAQQINPVTRVDIEVAPEQVDSAITALKSLGGQFSDITRSEATLTLAQIERESIPDMLSGLVGAGIRVYRAAPHDATLEDVYFALHRQEEA